VTPTTTSTLPIEETVAPADTATVAAQIKECAASETAVYAIGGGTSLDYGTPASKPGIGLSLENINSVVDYPARDMTITVEAGITMATLAATLAEEGQRVPLDVPAPELATLGGVIATNTSGALRYAHGTVRDYVIGIGAVDGRGVAFHGGGRVVKNVAGYDFCKLLTGSLGTLAVITEVTLKVKPVAETTAAIVADVADWDRAEEVLAALITSNIPAAMLDLVTGNAWNDLPGTPSAHSDTVARIVIGLEGTDIEIDWLRGEVRRLLGELGVTTKSVAANSLPELFSLLAAFPASGTPAAAESPLVVKANVVSSAAIGIVQALQSFDTDCSVQVHAGSGTVIARLSELPDAGAANMLVGHLQPLARSHHGNVIVLESSAGAGLTPNAIWGAASEDRRLMAAVKQKFDPHNILNPGRFVYEGL
jgi:glycolate oxidase FAD binding subunit